MFEPLVASSKPNSYHCGLPENVLDLRRAEDRATLSAFLTAQGLILQPAAVEFAANMLHDDWRVGLWPIMLNLWSSISGKLVIPLNTWAETLASVHEMREVTGIQEQIRRLGIASHESLDTVLAIRIAIRYHRAGCRVAFEPNGKGCSDLSINGRGFHLYCEVKRENLMEHQRLKSVKRASQVVLNSAREIVRWLEDRDLRMEIRFSRSFADNVAATVLQEIRDRIQNLQVNCEENLQSVAGSRWIVLRRADPEFYRSAIRSAQIEIKQSNVPVQIALHNMPIVVAFDREPNLRALLRRVGKAGRQLKNDRVRDPRALGFIVVETSHGELARDAITENFGNLPSNCIAVVVRSDVSTLVAREDVSAENVEIVSIAGTP